MMKEVPHDPSAASPTGGPDATRRGSPGLRLFGLLLLFVIGCVPLVAYLWETLNQLLSFQLDVRRLLVSLPVGLVLLLLVGAIAHTLTRFDASIPSDGG